MQLTAADPAAVQMGLVRRIKHFYYKAPYVYKGCAQ